jgi:hypothetical protein
MCAGSFGSEQISEREIERNRKINQDCRWFFLENEEFGERERERERERVGEIYLAAQSKRY